MRLAAAVLMLLVVPAAAGAKGTTTIRMTDAGVRIGAIAPAKLRGQTLTLPTAAGSATALEHRGGFTLRLGSRRARITRVRARISAGSSLSGVVRGRRIALVTLSGFPASGPGTAIIRDSTAKLAAPLARALGLGRGAPIAMVTVDARLEPKPPPAFRRPASATDVRSGTLTWHVRDSFIRYVSSGEGASAFGGATAGAPEVREGTGVPLVYEFSFPFASGWHDAASGRTALRFRGAVRFSYRGHGIDMRAGSPEIRLDGLRSHAVFTVDGTRGVLADLDPAKAGGDQIPAFVPRDAASTVFAGFYPAGDPFGWFVPRY